MDSPRLQVFAYFIIFSLLMSGCLGFGGGLGGSTPGQKIGVAECINEDVAVKLLEIRPDGNSANLTVRIMNVRSDNLTVGGWLSVITDGDKDIMFGSENVVLAPNESQDVHYRIFPDASVRHGHFDSQDKWIRFSPAYHLPKGQWFIPCPLDGDDAPQAFFPGEQHHVGAQ